MTVADLIKKLESLPQDARVLVNDRDYGPEEVDDAYLSTTENVVWIS